MPLKHDAVHASPRAAGTQEASPDTSTRAESGGYTCPMHSEVKSDVPGECSKCGMALEPRQVTVEEEKNPELVDMTLRQWVVLALATLAMGACSQTNSAIKALLGLAPRPHGESPTMAASPICR